MIPKDLTISDEVELQSIPFEKADALFDTLQSLSYIEFDYANNYCEDRAHSMALYLQKAGVTTAKIWMFVNGIWNNKYPKVLKVKDPNNINKKGYLTWKFHVAPIVLVKNFEQVDTLVFDPSLCEKPVPILAWLDSMNAKDEISLNDVFWVIRDAKYHVYPSKNKVPKLLEPWKLDKNLYQTYKGLCQGKILQEYLDQHPKDKEKRIKARKFKNLPKSYRQRLKPCMESLSANN